MFKNFPQSANTGVRLLPTSCSNKTARQICACVLAVMLVTMVPASLHAQAQLTLSPLESAAQLAFNPSSKVFTSITLQGTVNWKQGSLEDQGTVSLKSSSDGSTNETWSLGTVPYSYTTTALGQGRSCTVTSSKGVSQADGSSACLRVLPWFAPQVSTVLLTGALLNEASSATVSAPAASLQQATYTTGLSPASFSSPTVAADVLKKTAVRISYDPVTFLPSQEDFDYALDSDPACVIPYRILFSDYRLDQGLNVPHHIQRFVQRTLQADIVVTSVTVE